MARYRVCLLDAADFVQKTVLIDSGSDNEAIARASTFIEAGGQVDLWDKQRMIGPWIGSSQSKSGVFRSALVMRIRPRNGMLDRAVTAHCGSRPTVSLRRCSRLTSEGGMVGQLSIHG